MTTRDDHFAILVSIKRYPGLNAPLYGPENDAADFREWLLDPAGGNLPNNDFNIQWIKSSTYTPLTDPELADFRASGRARVQDRPEQADEEGQRF